MWEFLIYVAAIVGGLGFAYSRRNVVFPTYQGNSGLLIPVLAGAVAIVAVWTIGRWPGGSTNVFRDTSETLSFAYRFEESLGVMAAGAVVSTIAIIGYIAVITINSVKYGKAVM